MLSQFANDIALIGKVRPALDRHVRRLMSDQKGATAVEFAIVATPLFMILFGILELALIFIIDVNLNMATSTFSKRMRIGQLQATGAAVATSSGVQLDLADAKTFLCSNMYIVSAATCMQQLQIDIRPISSFSNATSINPVGAGTFDSTHLCYYSGDVGNIVEIRAYYLYSVLNPSLLIGLSTVNSYVSSSGTSSGSYFLLMSTQVLEIGTFLGSVQHGGGC